MLCVLRITNENEQKWTSYSENENNYRWFWLNSLCCIQKCQMFLICLQVRSTTSYTYFVHSENIAVDSYRLISVKQILSNGITSYTKITVEHYHCSELVDSYEACQSGVFLSCVFNFKLNFDKLSEYVGHRTSNFYSFDFIQLWCTLLTAGTWTGKQLCWTEKTENVASYRRVKNVTFISLHNFVYLSTLQNAI